MSLNWLLSFSFWCIGISLSLGVDYREAYFDQRIDHFNFVSYGNDTFRQRYLYNDTWWAREEGPIFFYTGNEGSVDWFWENSGFIMEIAEDFRALVLFAEHRFFGKSLPFGNASFERPNIGVLSVEQVLADYVFLLKDVKKNFKAENCPVVAFGGSYGGILASYMRFKYPNVVVGAIAASAPIYQFAGERPDDEFFHYVSKDFQMVSKKCEDQVRAAYGQLDKWASAGQGGLDLISKTLRLCNPLRSTADYDHLLRWSRNAFLVAALMDYPYPTNFMANFPAYPVNVMCDRLCREENPAAGLREACGLHYNSTGGLKCFDIYEEYFYCSDPSGCGNGTDSIAWDYQTCTELNSEAGTNGITDIFPVLPYNSSMRDEYCQRTWNVTPRRDWLEEVMWGKDILSSSNIVFSNGELDPCSSGGVLKNLTDTIVSVFIEGGAHHLDLRGSNPADPPSVKEARKFEAANISKWIQNYYKSRKRAFTE